MAFLDGNSHDIDEDLHNHQLAVYGRETMRRIANSNVLVVGMQGLGVEIAKNLILAGMKSVTLHDEAFVESWDLASNFNFTEKDIGKKKAIASLLKLQKLNNAVSVSPMRRLTKNQLSGFQAVVFTDIGLKMAIKLNNYCHNHQPPIAFIKAEVRGLFGSVFCDFGPAFTVLDVVGEDPCTAIVASICNSNPAQVYCVKDEKLKFKDGDIVVFSGIKGMIQLNDGKPRVILKSRSYSFTLDEDTTNFSAYEGGGIVKKVKVLNFKPLKDAITDPGDLSAFERSPLLHLAFQALDKFVAGQGCLPMPGSEEDAHELISIVRSLNEDLEGDRKIEDINPKLLQQFAFGARAVLNPMAAIFGGIVGQEVIKAISGKFQPIRFFYYDSVESLPAEPLEAGDFTPLNSRYDAQISVFGSKLQKKLEDAEVFVVGCGALGCEFLKNLALMGISCSKKGKLTITDDDVIEKSNLSSHFLFREGNIGQPKTTVAAASIRASINQQLNTEALLNRVDEETEDVFNAAFWEKLDVVVNALDNVDAKLYVDRRCLYFKKPFLESETVGTQCTTHMVIPDMTENYGSIATSTVHHGYSSPKKQAETTPCIATSAAMAAGFVCLELYKVLGGGHKIEDYRNVDSNLAVPSFTVSTPAAAKVTTYREMSWTVWDRWVIKDNPTFEQVFKWLAKEGLTATSVSCENKMLFDLGSAQYHKCLKKKVADIVKKVLRSKNPSFVDVEIICVDLDKKVIDIPLVSVYFREPEEASSSVSI